MSMNFELRLQSFWPENDAVALFVVKSFFNQMLFFLFGSRIASPQPSRNIVVNPLVMLLSLYYNLIYKLNCRGACGAQSAKRPT